MAPMKTFDQYLEESGEEFTKAEELVLEASNLRRKSGLSQSDLAMRMGTKQSVISRFENGGRTPTLEFLERLADALNGHLVVSITEDAIARIPQHLVERISTDANNRHISFNECVCELLDGMYDTTAVDALTQKIIPFNRVAATVSDSGWDRTFSKIRAIR